jgi:hypothetical protein
MTLRLPPKFVNVPALDVCGDMPDPLFRTLIQLHGLGWETPKGQPVRTPPATVLELAEVRGVTERQMYRYLKDLKVRGRIKIEHLGHNRFVIYPQGWKIDDSPSDDGCLTEEELADLAGDATAGDFTEENFSKAGARSNGKEATPSARRPDSAADSVARPSLEPGVQAAVFFRPWLEEDQLGEPQWLALDEAVEKLLAADGEWYFSEADLADAERAGEYGPEETATQAALDARLLGDCRAILIADDDSAPAALSLAEIARRSAQSRWARPAVRYSLWEFLGLTAPEDAREMATQRREMLERLQAQAEAWGDPDMVAALGMEPFFISPDDARQLVAEYGIDAVGGWLRALRANPGNAQSLAGVLISRLRTKKAPPNGGKAEKKEQRWLTDEEYERFFRH